MSEQMVQDTIAAERIDDTVIVTVGERMDIFNAPLIMKEFDALLQTGTTHFIVDLSAVRVVDADGDYPLLHLLKCAQASGGSVTLICPEGNPICIFYEMMRLDTLFDIAPSMDAVCARYGPLVDM